MKYRTNSEKATERNRIRRSEEIRNYNDSKPEKRDPKAYERFKSLNTDYSTRKCSYLDMKNPCNTKCIFWETCKHGMHEYEWKGGINHAQSNKENENSKQ